MKSDRQPASPRAHVATSGTFAAVPQGFPGADGSLASALKPEFAAVPTAGDPSRVFFVTPPDRVLLDFAAVDPADLDPAKLARTARSSAARRSTTRTTCAGSSSRCGPTRRVPSRRRPRRRRAPGSDGGGRRPPVTAAAACSASS